ncbi:MAG: DUF5710 domain-containing protein [Methylococcales bacterium]
MSDSKTYLTVPYAQKDAAKALGARWDPAIKKWYVSGSVDINLFSAWQPVVSNNTNISQIKTKASSNDNGKGAVTYPTDNGFVAYSGERPPWD